MEVFLYLAKDFDATRGYQEYNNLLAASKCFDRVYLLTNNKKSYKDHHRAFEKVKNISLSYYKSLRIFSDKIFPFTILYNLIKIRPKIIFIHDFYFCLFPLFIYKKIFRLESKVIFVSHSDFTNTGRRAIVRILYYKFFLRFFVIMPFRKVVDYYFGINPSSVFFLRTIGIKHIEIQLFRLSFEFETLKSIDVSFQKKLLNLISEDDLVIVSGGRLTRYKNTESLISSFVKANKNNQKLFIFGDSDDPDYLKYLKDLAFPNSNIHFLGLITLKQVDTLMSLADIAIFPASQSVLWQRSLCHGLLLVIGRYITFDGFNYLKQDVDYLNENNSLIILENTSNKEEEIFQLLRKVDKNIIIPYKKAAKKYSSKYLDLLKNFQSFKINTA